MPLYNKKPLARIHPPVNVNPRDKVYFLEASGEIFTTYDDFFNRMILLNSTDFSCSLTGKTGLTYFEALDSEKEAKDELKNFPDFLQEPILYMVQYLTCRGRLDDVLSDVTIFMKDRYFIGEELLWHDGKQKRAARIHQVFVDDNMSPPRVPGGSPRKGGAADMGMPPPEAYRYEIQLLDDDEDDEDDESDDGIREATAGDLSRNRVNMNKQKLKLFLKNTCVLIDKRQEIKESFCRDFRLDQRSWGQYFTNPAPLFPQTPLLFRGRPTKAPLNLESAEPKEKGQRGRKRKDAAEKNAENPTKRVR